MIFLLYAFGHAKKRERGENEKLSNLGKNVGRKLAGAFVVGCVSYLGVGILGSLMGVPILPSSDYVEPGRILFAGVFIAVQGAVTALIGPFFK